MQRYAASRLRRRLSTATRVDGVSPGQVKGGVAQQNPPGLGYVTLRHTAQRAPQ
jgi:hypothetical protein